MSMTTKLSTMIIKNLYIGLIELFYGERKLDELDFLHSCTKRGDILIFPSWLRHTVYAHYEAGKIRISVAGNVSFK